MSTQARQALFKQLGLPANLFGSIASAFRRPCDCQKGICGCCTGMLFSALRQVGCMNITYHPDDFSFEFKMLMNNAVLYKNRVTGRNPPPVCVRMPRFSFVKVCASFFDLHFIGRNMHVCLEMSAFFQESEIFNRYLCKSFWIVIVCQSRLWLDANRMICIQSVCLTLTYNKQYFFQCSI